MRTIAWEPRYAAAMSDPTRKAPEYFHAIQSAIGQFPPIAMALARRLGVAANDRAAPAQHRQRQRHDFRVEQFAAPAEGGARSTPHFNASEHVTSATGANVPGVNHVRHSFVSSWRADRNWDLIPTAPNVDL